jgi:hypothetical protein
LRVSNPEHHRRGGEWVKVSDRSESKEERDEESSSERGIAHKGTPIFCREAIVKFCVLSRSHVCLGKLKLEL